MQAGFFDISDRYSRLSELGDPLEVLSSLVDFEMFRKTLDQALARKSGRGRPPFDSVMMFKILILKRLYHLSDDQLEFQITDRSSFRRFLSINENSCAPDSKTIWAFCDQLSQSGALDRLFTRFEAFLHDHGYAARGGAMIDATFVEVPKQRNKRDDNEAIKAGEVPEDFKKSPHVLAQKDMNARWTKKSNEVFYGYKNHVQADTEHKFVRAYEVTSAEVHDSQLFEPLLAGLPEGTEVFADSAYRTPGNKVALWTRNLIDQMHYKGARNKPLREALKERNHTRSKTRVRVEHIFGHMQNSLKADLIRTIGMTRAKAQIALTNLTYNLCRFVSLNKPTARATG